MRYQRQVYMYVMLIHQITPFSSKDHIYIHVHVYPVQTVMKLKCRLVDYTCTCILVLIVLTKLAAKLLGSTGSVALLS